MRHTVRTRGTVLTCSARFRVHVAPANLWRTLIIFPAAPWGDASFIFHALLRYKSRRRAYRQQTLMTVRTFLFLSFGTLFPCFSIYVVSFFLFFSGFSFLFCTLCYYFLSGHLFSGKERSMSKASIPTDIFFFYLSFNRTCTHTCTHTLLLRKHLHISHCIRQCEVRAPSRCCFHNVSLPDNDSF